MIKNLYLGSIWTSKNGFTKFVVFAKIFEINADASTINDWILKKRITHSAKFTKEKLQIGQKMPPFFLKKLYLWSVGTSKKGFT